MASVEQAVERPPSLARAAAVITMATVVSRITGFIRVAVLAAALGGTFLVNTYQTANTAPNVLFELVAAGVLTSVFVPTFVDYLVRRERAAGWDAANALTSVALLSLVGLALCLGLAAPWVMRLLTVGVENDALREDEIALGSTFLRLFAPQIVFYGVGMIMTGALHAHRRFAMAAVAPIFNNLVVIAAYVAYALMRGDRVATIDGATTGEVLVLGLGTTMGVVAMTACLAPQLFKLGWRFRWSLDLGHEAVRKAARVGVWTLGYAGGYQAGLIVVLVLANRIGGGVAAYQWAYVFFYVPHALFAAPIFHVLFPAMSEDIARGEHESLAERLGVGMRMLFFILAPSAAVLAVAADPIARVTLEYGVMGGAEAGLVARVIAAFAVGLPTYSAFLVLTRAFYAAHDAKTPALVNLASVAVSSLAGAALFFSLPDRWAIPGLALGHSIGFLFGTIVLAALLARRGLGLRGRTALSALRSVLLAVLAGAVVAGLLEVLPSDGKADLVLSLVVACLGGAVVYVGTSVLSGSTELVQLAGVALRRQTGAPNGRVLEVFGPSEGGIARHVSQLVQGLEGRNDLVVDIAGPPDAPVPMPKPVKPLHIPSGIRGHRAAMREIRRLLNDGGYGVVHAHGLRAGIDSALAARGTTARPVMTLHNLVLKDVAGRGRAWFLKRTEPLAVRLNARTFAASEQIADHLRAVAPDDARRIETLHAPVATPEVTMEREEVRRMLEVEDHHRLVVTVARLAPQKALDVMLRALARLEDDVVLCVVGSGPLERELKDLASELGVERRVRWVGFREDAGNFIAAADVMCLSSVWEAVALAAQEAVLLGIPVVSTDVGGMGELITDGVSGRLVAKGDDAALAAALADVLRSESKARAFAEAAAKGLDERFSRDKMLGRLEREYRGADA